MPTVHARTVRRASESVGGIGVLAGHLKVREEFLKRWIEGELTVPKEVFFRCVDVVNAHQLDELGGQTLNNSVPKGPTT